MGKVLSALIFLTYLILMYMIGGAEWCFRLFLLLLLPLACIWFPEELGDYTGLAGRGYVSESSPGWLVALVGWILLLLGGPLLLRAAWV